MNNVLVIGNGGREHAMVLALLRSPQVLNVYILNGNGGTEGLLNRTFNIPEIKTTEHEKILKFIQQNNISLTIIGPEAPLSEGIVDFLENNGEKVFGPRKAGAELEASKIFMKDVLVKSGVPTAKYRAFQHNELNEAIEFLEEFNGSAIVIKADGLAAGKGVVICENKQQAEQEIREFLNGKFGSSSKKIVIEEFLDGFEASLFGISDGKNVICFGSACDYKRIYENDLGLNTGGMGTFSPSFLTKEEEETWTQELIKPVVDELAVRGITYKGVLFAGLMVCEGVPKLLEFNARLGDPETQSILARFEGDFYEMCKRVAEGNLGDYKPKFSKKTAVSVVFASRGYPEGSSSGDEISLPTTLGKDEFIFHAGTKLKEGKLCTNGGRILAVTALGTTKQKAREKAYKLATKVKFNGMQFRKDIAEELTILHINFEEEGWKVQGIGFYSFFAKLLKLTLKEHFKHKSLGNPTKCYEFSVLLTNDKKIHELNLQHRGKDKPTNVLSFPIVEEYEEGKILMGDIVISLQTMLNEAKEQKKPFVEHLAHLFIHSALHLLGYDHEKQDEMHEMEELEDKILNQIFS